MTTRLTILQVGETPAALRERHGRYPRHFQEMFERTGEPFVFETIFVLDGEKLPDPATLEGAVITGSAAGVYDDHHWMDPLRDFIRAAYAARTPMLGVCFGHQIMADALGGDVRKSEKGWGLGRHVYRVTARPEFLPADFDELAIAASHQDQVMAPPEEAEVFLSSEFTPNAGLVYRNGAAVSLQPHPEFDVGFSRDLVEIRRNNPLRDEQVEAAHNSFEAPLDNHRIAQGLARFFRTKADKEG
ncbi:MAG TPA: gamma-glutamyl-gamma-aminobutyrate hydrolase family protein [Devosiaceae bacterium]